MKNIIANILSSFWLRAFGYIFLIQPPRVIDIISSHKQSGGELAYLPYGLVVIFETAIRVALLSIVAVALEYIITKNLYETFYLDYMFMLFLILGGLQSFLYYIFFILFSELNRDFCYRIYRFFRNTLYSFIPGLLISMPFVLYNYFKSNDLYNMMVFGVYLVSTGVAFTLGAAEALSSKNRPLGVDREHDDV